MVTLLNDWAGVWGPYFLAAVVQNTLFLGLVFLLLRILRRASARVLALVATVGVVKLVIPPFLSPSWLGSKPVEQVVQPVSSLLFPFADAGVTPGETAVGTPAGFSILTWLMLVWTAVVLVRLGHGLWQTVQLALAIRNAERIPDAGIPRQVLDHGLSVWRSPGIAMPLTLGLRPRRIHVPANWSYWPAANRRAVLLHELEHVRRHDGVVQVLEILAQAVFFFLPPVTWLVRRLHMFREMACDDASVSADPLARLEYSRFLCSLAESILETPRTTASASTLARRRSELLDRVSYQVKEGVVKKVSGMKLALVVAALACTALPLSLVYGVNPQDPPPPPPAKAKAPGETLVRPGDEGLKEIPPPPPPLSVKVTIDGDNRILVANQPVLPKDFKKAVKDAVAKKGNKAVINIDSDGGVSMAQLHKVQKDLRDMGLLKVIYSGELGEAVPMVLPPGKAREKLVNMPPDKIINVEVDGQGVVHIDGQQIAGAKIPARIDQLLTEDAHRIVVLHTDPDTKYGAFVQVLDSLKQGGANKIAINDPGR